MRIRLPLPGGTLKVKTYRYLRRDEREKKVPVMKLGNIYFVWWNLQRSKANPDALRD